MGKIYNLFSTSETVPTTHSVNSANDLLPLIRRYTQEAVDKTEALSVKLQYLHKDGPEFKLICREYDEVVMRWAERVHRLGGLAKGLWLVDFDTGEGYLCWKHPEMKVDHYHPYDGGYKTRVPIEAARQNPL